MNILLITVLMSRYIENIFCSNKVYNIKEETEIGYVIDYIKSNGQRPSRIFNVNDTGVNCFNLDLNSGKLLVVRRIDREDLCNSEKRKKYRKNQCEIIIKIAYESLNVLEKVIIIIDDVNDNEPKWTTDLVNISFNENEPIGGRRSLPEAIDIDTGVNSEINYRIESKYRNYFRLSQDNGLYIENTQVLDREKQDFYEIILLAYDNGIPAKSNQLKIVIEVVDINDNSPQFTERVFRPERVVPENVDIGTLILTLKATDPDAGRNGEVFFRMNKNTATDVKKYLHVKESGEIFVKSLIDYDNGNSRFEFKVVVEDKAVLPYSRSSEAVVEIDIQDVNDEFPEIQFYAIHTSPTTGRATIDENLPVMTAIGQLSVKDVDFKGQDKVTCEPVGSTNQVSPVSIMSTNDVNEFQVVSNRKFDRESDSEILCQIVCSDIASHVTRFNFTLSIGDVNDNAPIFSKTVFHFYINENEPIGSLVSNRMFVSDQDHGENRLFTLSVESPDDKLFTVDQQDQILRSMVVFDRETTSQYKMKVIAVDHGIVRLTGSCMVVVHVRDVNDNPVILHSLSVSFHILENNKPRTIIGYIKATDPDNQTIFYAIDYSAQLRFEIEKYSGNFLVQKPLDREEQDVHYVVVLASDGVYTATTTVTVFVDDINDNAPAFVPPTTGNRVIKIDIKETPGYRIATFVAKDPDHGENGQVRYSLRMKNTKHTLFNLDGETGDIYLAASLQNVRIADSSSYLDIEACDQGKPRLCSVLSGLEIQWNSQRQMQPSDGNGQLKPFSVEYFLNENVLILAISGLLVLMIIIMVIFVLLRQKSGIFIRRRNTTNLSVTNKSLNKTLICYPENYGPPDYRCSTELENLDTDARLTSEKRTTPNVQCSNLYMNESKSINDVNQPSFCGQTPADEISVVCDRQPNSSDLSKISQDNYYSKYITDRYCKIMNTESPILKLETNYFKKSQSLKNHSSFV